MAKSPKAERVTEMETAAMIWNIQAIARIVLWAVLAATGGASSADAPGRVVSINLCTDQLAILLAAPGQLISVSRLAHDPDSSAMAEQARAFPRNAASAEDVYLLKPDLVLAGTFTSAATIGMLRDLGIKVEQFAPARSLADVPARLRQMGAILNRQAKAEEQIHAFSAQLDMLQDAPPSDRFRAAITYVNSYSSGDATLAGDVLRIAGFDNAATEVGLKTSGKISLEELILLAPDVIIQGRDYPGAARAEDALNHPALRALNTTLIAGEINARDWVCGTPQVLHAIETLRALRLRMEAAR